MSTSSNRTEPAHGSDELSIVTVAAAAASGIGVLGFVTFAGGVVLWTRFDKMGLSADRAVAAVPSSELVATGAVFLVPALGLAAVAMLGVLWVDQRLRQNETLTREERLRHSAWRTSILAVLIELVGAIVAGPGGARIAVLVVVALASGIVINYARKRTRLPAFSLVAFLAIGTFWLARAYESTAHSLKVIPMAYSRMQPGRAARVEIGYFVAETSDRIFFAAAPKTAGNELREFPRSETDDVEIGELTPIGEARKRASVFGYNLCTRLLYLSSASNRNRPRVSQPGVCDAQTIATFKHDGDIRA